jgi:hypothetical protein
MARNLPDIDKLLTTLTFSRQSDQPDQSSLPIGRSSQVVGPHDGGSADCQADDIFILERVVEPGGGLTTAEAARAAFSSRWSAVVGSGFGTHPEPQQRLDPNPNR